MKYCTKCNQDKPITEFNKIPNTNRHRSECKSCIAIINKEYRRKPENVIRTSWHHNCYHAEQRGHSLPSYSYDELLLWAFSQDVFNALYDAWVDSGYKRLLKPSVDRLDDNKSYSLDNIQIISFADNEEKYRAEVRAGTKGKMLLNGGHQKVKQYTLDGILIAEHVSQSQASRETTVNQACISDCCRGIQKTAGGFIWQTV